MNLTRPRQTRSLITILIAILLTIIFCPLSTASTQPDKAMNKSWYQVELIYFSQISQGEQQLESWPYISPFMKPSSPLITLTPTQTENSTPVATNHASEAKQTTPSSSHIINSETITTPTQIQNKNYILLPSSYFKLSKIATALRAASAYHLISHISWLEQVPTRANNIPTLYMHAHKDDMSINSLIRLYRQRYFEVHFNTTFNLPVANIARPSTAIDKIVKDGSVRFLLTQNRRMRSNELNYIDFPYFGVLIEIYPINEKQLAAIQGSIKTIPTGTDDDTSAPVALAS